ncbi:MAG: VOC family protein [Pseudomonadales bacterium]|nr:VOC family protein [Pseudomonadales bacterium]
MLHLEHINLVVEDIPRALKFYQAAFPHWHIREKGEGQWSGKSRSWLHFGDDYQYLAFGDNGTGNNRDLEAHDTGLAHFAFACSNLDAVVARLKEAGFPVDKDGASEPHRKNVYFIDLDGFEVEFVEYLSDLPRERNFS